MTDLQDDIDFFDQMMGPRGGHLGGVVDAARRVANPDYEAAAKRRYEDVKGLAEQHGLIGLIDWDDLEDDERQQMVAASHSYIDPALGILEDE